MPEEMIAPGKDVTVVNLVAQAKPTEPPFLRHHIQYSGQTNLTPATY
jgi:hypothetical protein